MRIRSSARMILVSRAFAFSFLRIVEQKQMHFPARRVLLLYLAVVCSVLSRRSSLQAEGAAARHRQSCAVRIRGTGGKSLENVADIIARRNGFRNLGKIGNLEDMYLFEPVMEATQRSISGHSGVEQERRSLLSQQDQLEAEEHVEYVLDQTVQQRAKRSPYSPPSDPFWPRQWSLLNGGQEEVGGRFDLKVEPAWIQGLTGRGVTVAVADDGLWYTHPDLTANFRSKLSWDFIDSDGDVMPRRNRENHGTSCAGVVAMTRSNGICGTGIAYESQIAGLRMLDGDDTTDAIEASALGFATQHIDIYSSSWGPYDNGFTVGGPGPILAHVLQRGAEEGRGGKGVIYVWASGNGGRNGDTCAMDGYVSSIYTIAVGSVDQRGVQAPFDEDCTGKLAVAVNHNSNGGNSHQVVTTDNRNKCRGSFKGTSAAAPLLAGIIALTLQANDNLTWRDVQYLIVHTSRHQDLTTPREPSPWTLNGAGLWVSHHFGFGAIDAEAMVTRARHWTNVPEQTQTTLFPDIALGMVLANSSLAAEFSVEANESDIRSLEHVVVRLSLAIENYTAPRSLAQYHIMQSLLGTHFDQADINGILQHNGARRGNVEITLTSPSGTESILLPRREKDFVNTGTLSWSLMSVLHWGESPVGRWRLLVNFNSSEGYVHLSALNVTLYGISESSVESVSDECSSECEGKCARAGPSYCDVCRSYRDAQRLTCIASCTFTHQIRGKYCIPLAAHTSSGPLETTPTVSISPHTDGIPIIPTSTLTPRGNPSDQDEPHQQMYTNSRSLTHPLSSPPLSKSKFLTNTHITATSEETTLDGNDVMMTSSLLLPTRASLLTADTLRPTNTHRATEVAQNDRERACSATISSTNFLITCFLLVTACCYGV